MGNFAANAIGLFLQLEDQLTPALRKAGVGYERFVRRVVKWNDKAGASASAGLASIGKLVESFESLPKRIGTVYQQARKELTRRMTPLTQRVNVEFAPRSAAGIGKAVSAAVARTLSKVTLRLSAAVPRKKSPVFDESKPLRRLYNRMAQPPDMRGGFQGIPRYAHGGTVPNAPNVPLPGPDNVLSLLSPGEMVVPVKQTGAFVRAANALGSTVPKALAGVLADVQLQIKALGKAKALVAAGVDPNAEGLFVHGLQDLDRMLKAVAAETATLSTGMKGALVGSFGKTIAKANALTAELGQMNQQGQQAAGVFAGLLTKVLGYTRFLAVSKAVGVLTQSLSRAYHGAQELFNTVGGEQIDDFVTNMNRSNKSLGLSRAALGREKVEFAALARQAGVTLTGMGEANESLIQSGVISSKLRKDLAPGVALMAEATNASSDAAASLSYQLNQLGKMSSKQVDDLHANVAQFATMFDGAMDPNTMEATLHESFRDMGEFIVSQSGGVQAKVMTHLAAIGTAFGETFAGKGDEMMKVVAEATQSTPHGVERAGLLFGMSPDDVQRAVQTREGMIGLVRRLGDTLRSTDAFGRQTIAESIGLQLDPQQLGQFATRVDDVTAAFGRMSDAAFTDGKGLEYLQQRARDNRTWFQNLTASAMSAFASMELFGVSGVDVINFFKEFNPVAAYSSLMLVKELGPGLAAVGGGLKGLIVWLAQAVAGWFGYAGATTAAATATAAVQAAAAPGAVAGGGIAAFLSGLGAGLAALTPAIPVIVTLGLVFSAAAVAIGFALKLAAPAIEAFGRVMVGVVDAFAKMGAGQILASAAALLALGPAFAMMGAGVLVGATALAVAAVPLAVFAGAMALIGAGAANGAGTVAAAVDAIAAAFVVDRRRLADAVEGVRLAGQFMVGFVAVAAGVVGAGLAAGALTGSGLVGGFIKGVTTFFFGDPMQNLVGSADRIAATVNTLAGDFAGRSWAKDLPAVARNLETAGKFMEGVGKIAKTANEAAPVGGLFGKIKAFFVGDAFEELVGAAPRMTATVNALVGAFKGAAWRTDLPAVAKSIEGAGNFMGSVGKIADATMKIAELTSVSVFNPKAIVDKATGNTFLDNALKSVQGLVVLVGAAVTGFAPLAARSGEAAKVAAGLAPATDLFARLADVAARAKDFAYNAGQFKPDDVAKGVDAVNRSIAATAAVQIGAAGAAGPLAGVRSATDLLTALTAYLTQGAAFNKAYDAFAAAGDVAPRFGRVADDMRKLGAAVAAEAKSLALPLPVTRAQIDATTRTVIEGHVTSDDAGTHDRLDRLIALLSGGGNPTPQAAPPAAARPADDATRRAGGGGGL